MSLLLVCGIGATGKVYLVLGSDTAIWEGMDVARQDPYYSIDLYTNQARNAYAVMDPTWRSQFTDSYGNTMKLTWWMMGGNIFRQASNNNVPVNNTMSLYLMKKYHGDHVIELGDELSIHYHTFWWTDYDGDGNYWWNQSLTFLECIDDWYVTLGQYLLEENVFPVSFRSGWHYMDNDWQAVLDQWIPYSMHNDWPNVRIDTSEPLDNSYNWFQASSEFVPYRPSPENYQLPGEGSGWNLRSAHLFTVRYQNLMDTLFYKASLGIDQVACFWGHLPESDFLDNLEIIDSLAHQASDEYPEVNFQYCTAVEAMQLWLGYDDITPPDIDITAEVEMGGTRITVTVNEELFQPQPFITIKDRREEVTVYLEAEETSMLEWEVWAETPLDQIGKIGVAATDTSGNVGTEFLTLLPDDWFIDNLDSEYQELEGNWQLSSFNAWGIDSRFCQLMEGDSAVSEWVLNFEEGGLFHLFGQWPEALPIDVDYTFIITSDTSMDTVMLLGKLAFTWNYITTVEVNPGEAISVIQKVRAGSDNITVWSDALKLSAYIRDRDISVTPTVIDLGEISQLDTITTMLNISNTGVDTLMISSIHLASGDMSPNTDSYNVLPMGSQNIPLTFYFPTLGIINDTLLISSNDPATPLLGVPVAGIVQPYFITIDNDDASYLENGDWFTSNAQAYGYSSRYCWLNTGGWASFTQTIAVAGNYDVFEIVPATVNASNQAAYRIWSNDALLDSVMIDQNEGSGNWKLIGQHFFPVDASVTVEVMDVGASTTGTVLRADAIKIQLVEGLKSDQSDQVNLPSAFRLGQSFPNPFNTTVSTPFEIPTPSYVSLNIYDLRGHLVNTLVNRAMNPGFHLIRWRGQDNHGHLVSSGVYLVMLETGDFRNSHKIMLIK